jgi:hypothetical protein
MRTYGIAVLTTIALGTMVFASPVMAQSASQSYWQTLKRNLTNSATTGEVHKNVPGQVAATRG